MSSFDQRKIKAGGQHKTRWLLAAIGVVTLIGLTSGPASSVLGAEAAFAGCANSNADPRSVSTAKAERAVVCLVNRKRQKKGMDRLRSNKSLTRAAGSHSKVMRSKHCFSHTCSGEPALGDRLKNAGYLPCNCSFGYGETIAWGRKSNGSPRSIVMSWMKSSSHRQILLDRRYEHIGVGVAWGSPSSKSADAGLYTADLGFKN